MTRGKVKWPRSAALEVARELCARLKPHCSRLVVAGSLRRRGKEVGDVEILYVPMCERRKVDLLSDKEFSLADEEIERMKAEGILSPRPSTAGVMTWGDKNKLALHRGGMPVDLFRTSEEAWWNYLVCRTGPSELNVRIAEAAKEKGWKWNPYGAGFTRQGSGDPHPVASEREVFEFVGLPYAEPWDRS